VRTPMQWSIDRNAGFSRADPQRLYLPVIMDPIYGYQAVNVEAQSRDPSSLLNWTRRILAVRRQLQSLGRGALEIVRPQNRKIFAYVRTFDKEIVLCVANLAQTAQAVELDLAAYKGRVPVELLGRNAFPPIGELPYFLTLPAHGFFWLLLSDTEAPPAWHVERLPATELPILVLPAGLATLMENAPQAVDRAARRTLKQLEEEVLPEFLRQRRWFAGKGGKVVRAHLASRTVWESRGARWLVALVEVDMEDGAQQRYFLPLSLAWDDGPDGGVLRTAEWTLAKVREAARVGVLVDAFADPGFCLAVISAVESAAAIPFDGGEIRFTPTSAFADLAQAGVEPVHHLGREQSNTSVILGESLFLKAYRQSRGGVNPDMELPRHLTQLGFKYIAPLAGAVEYVRPDAPPTTLAAVFAFARNQGDGWSYALNHLERVANELLAAEASDAEGASSPLFMAQMRTLGKRVGEMHAALASDVADPDFKPEPIEPGDLAAWAKILEQEAQTTFGALEQRSAELPEAVQASAREVLEARQRILQRIASLASGKIDAFKTRYHGDLHLGQVLLTADDFLITDFEGEPARAIEERRRKSSPLKDVAGMLRSFDYARAVALERVLTGRPDLGGRVEPAFEAWHADASAAFMKGYRKGIGKARSMPAKTSDAQRLIDLFQMEKALYELRYEIDNRPAWLNVPARGLLRLLGV
jgi:maltose alpha-D-glucosyltransferase / alpha-amylase